MHLSALNLAASEQFFDRELYQGQLDLMRHAVVKLYGGVHNANFTGTGVLCRVDSNRTYILTAKHNLHVAGTHLQNDYADYFCARIRVRLTKLDQGPEVEGRISHIDFADGTEDDENYDVAALRVANHGALAFAGHARHFITPGPSTAWMYASLAWRNQRLRGDPQLPIFDLLTLAEVQQVLRNGDAIGGFYTDPDYEGWHLVQFGHGQTVGENYGFTRRALAVAALTNPTYLQQSAEGYTHVFTFDTDDDNTSRRGDSGGPIFAVSRGTETQTRKIYLIGVNLGADYFANAEPDTDETRNNAFTIVASDTLNGII